MNLFFTEYRQSSVLNQHGKRRTRKEWANEGYQGFAALCYFAGCPADLPLDDLDKYFSYRELSKGKELISINKPSDDLYFIVHGKVKVISRDPNGTERLYAMFNDGSAVTSIPSFYFNDISSYTILAGTALKALVISKKDYKRLCDDKPQFVNVQHFVIAKRLDYQLKFDKLHYLTAKDKVEKLSEYFPSIFDNFYDKEIAELLGIKKETFSRAKKQLGLKK